MSEPISNHQAGALIERAVKERCPFSFLRLGDGEGLLLDFEPDAVTEDDAASFHKHFGKAITHDHLTRMRRDLEEAVFSADLIGLSWAFYEKRDLLEVRPDMEPHGAVRHGKMKKWWAQHGDRVTASMSDAHLQWPLAQEGFWQRLLCRETRIGLINASPTLPAKIEHAFSLTVDHIRVPERHVHRQRWADDGAEVIYPDAFERVTRCLESMHVEDTVFLVGAGLSGKAYCHTIRALGGIALDLGALLDAWDGRETRKRVLAQLQLDLDRLRLQPPPQT